MAEIDREITTGQAGYLRRRYLGGADETDGGQRRGLSVEEYLKMPYRMEIIPVAEEGGYTVIFPELPGRLTCGETMQEAMANVEEAKREWILCVFDDGQPIPLPKNGHEIILLLNGRSSRRFLLSAWKATVSVQKMCYSLATKMVPGGAASGLPCSSPPLCMSTQVVLLPTVIP